MVELGDIITLQGVGYAYPARGGKEVLPGQALDNIDLGILPGEFVAVIGHNGSGKSTLARLLNGLLLPTRGKVLVGGRCSRDPENLWYIRQQVGMVFQNPENQIVATTVEEDVAFGPENLGLPPEIIRERVDGALGLVGILPLKQRPPHLLSGGEKQKVAIAGVLAMRPRCIVLDESTALLDPGARRRIMELVWELNLKEKVAIVFITHFMEEAARADRVIVMEMGRIIMAGSPREIFPRVEELKEAGLGVPQVTELAGLLKRDGLDIAEDILEVEEMVESLCSCR